MAEKIGNVEYGMWYSDKKARNDCIITEYH